MSAPLRVLVRDSTSFGDTQTERENFERFFDDVRVEVTDADTETVAEAGDVDVLVTMEPPVTADLLDALSPSVVSVFATGVDWVDVDAATERGIPVTRVPEYCTREVGEHAISLALALVRRLPQLDADTAAGNWDWSVGAPYHTFDELTLGLLAFGRKARATAEPAAALGFDVLAHDPYVADEEIEAAGVTPVDFETLLESADVLSAHTPLTDETRDYLDADAFARMSEGSMLVNTSRGAVVDEDALVDALDDGPLVGAALDVLRREPPEAGNPLLDRDDVLVTPHAAWASEGATARLHARGAEIAAAAYEGRAVDGVVNPEVL